MENWSCAFIGHRVYNYNSYIPKLKSLIEDLIKRGVTHFYSWFQGHFDIWCANLVNQLQQEYPHIKNVLVLYSKPNENIELPFPFDEAVYLDDNHMPQKSRMSYINRKLVQSVNFVISGAVRGYDGAMTTCRFAKLALKAMYNVVTGDEQFWYGLSPIEIEKTLREHDERMQTDEEYRKMREAEVQKLIKLAEENTDKRGIKRRNKKQKEYHAPVWITVATKERTP